MSAKFEIKQGSSEQYRFNLKAANGEIILSSESYKEKEGARKGIESVKKNAPDDARYERKTASNGQPFFVLKAANGEVRVRWLGHRLHAELNVAVAEGLSVEQGHDIANRVRHELLHNLQFLSNATIHIDPANASGEKYHHIEAHAHGGEPAHSH